MSLRPLLLAALVLAAGCGGATTLPFVGGPSSRPAPELFQHATETARAHGYTLLSEDPGTGRFTVQAHTTGNRGQTATFVVQFYQPGWVQITAESSLVRRDGDRMHMPGALFEELRDFSVWVAGPLGSDGAGGER